MTDHYEPRKPALMAVPPPVQQPGQEKPRKTELQAMADWGYWLRIPSAQEFARGMLPDATPEQVLEFMGRFHAWCERTRNP